jgi:hypothetical protein
MFSAGWGWPVNSRPIASPTEDGTGGRRRGSNRNGRIGADARRGRSLLPALAALLFCACAAYRRRARSRGERRTLRGAAPWTQELRAQFALLPQTAAQPWPPTAWNRAELLAEARAVGETRGRAPQVEAAVALGSWGRARIPNSTQSNTPPGPHPWLWPEPRPAAALVGATPARFDLARLGNAARCQLMDSAWGFDAR